MTVSRNRPLVLNRQIVLVHVVSGLIVLCLIVVYRQRWIRVTYQVQGGLRAQGLVERAEYYKPGRMI